MSKYLLSPNAVRSLEDIETYSLANFGHTQTGIYLRKLHEIIKFTANNPKVGKLRKDLFIQWDCYSYPVGNHTIYYEIVSDQQINIIDILHQSMEPRFYLLDEE
ncbi:MAG: type II toxin-antitoxin system RelE/ParE family toxin [Burkholderiales bacterium]|nr:type II toxin-antitoxin system RelE/ParE family toxin [Burkholderiales bacterium]MDR4518681.1 type II toxin-antitoxin system RelE/ParE family toxin [Nitrosomonas sp.]